MEVTLALRIVLASTLLLLAACQSTMHSDSKPYSTGEQSLYIAARAELGASSDQIILTVNDTEVASGSFESATAAGLTLQGEYEGIPIQAHCTFRWRVGLHIGHRCKVYIDGDGPVVLDF